MENYLHIVNRAIEAEKNIYINLSNRMKNDSSSNSLRGNPRPNRYPCATLALPLRYLAMIFAVLVMSMANVGMAWGDVLWQSDMQESISGVTITKLNNSDTWATGLNLAWAPGLPKAYQPSGSGRGVQLAFDTPLSLQSGDIIRVFAGGTNNTERTLSLFLNDGGSAVGTVSLPNGTLRVLDYPISSATMLNKIKITSTNNAVYIFKVIIFRNVPATGTTTITYEMRYKNKDVQGRTDNCISTITGLSSAFTLNGLTTSTSNGIVSFCGEITGHPTSEDNTKNVDLQFTIANGYTFTPSSVSFKWDGNNSAVKAKVTITDGTTTVTSNESTASGSPSVSNAKSFSFASGAFDGKTFTGTVHIKVHIWSSSTGKRAFILSPFSLTGTVASAAPEPECGSTSQEALTLSSNSGTICGTGTATFTVSGGSGSGALSVSSSDETKATASIDGSTVTVTGVAAGSATITVTKACDATYAEKTATYSATVAAIPTANAGADKTTEPGNGVALAATAAASGCTGAWTIQSGPNTSTAQLSSTSSATATFTPTVAGTYTLRWTVTNTSSSCSAYDEMTVSAAVCSISECGNATLTYPIYTSGDLTTSNLFSGATSSNATAVSVGSSPAFTGVAVSAATKGSSANAGACYAKSTALTGKMQYSASSKSSSYYIDFPFTVNTGYTFTPCDVQVVIQPVSSNQAFTVEITNGTNVYGTTTATLNAGVMEPIIGLTSPAEMSAGNYAVRLYPHGGSSKEFRMGANVILKGTTASAAPSCTAPNHVDVTPTAEAGNYGWRYTIGETLKLTATPYSSEGTSSPITSGITGYQWQKYVGSEWENLSNGGDISGATSANLVISNLTSSNGGSYRCVVSTGATCSLASDGYWVRVFTLNGNYSGSAWTENPIVWTGTNTGVATVNLNASSTYMFKVTDNDGKWFGYTANNFIIQPQARDCGTGNSDIRLFTGPAGNYTFTINIEHAAEGSPYVNISVAYPEVSHPNSGYMYITKWWDCYIHYWEGTNNALTAWGSDPKINSDRYVEICGTNYWYFPVIATYNKFIAKDATGDAGNTTGDQVSTDHGGKYITHDGSWGWHDFTTYSITYTGNGGGGSMSATSGICPDADQAITSNAFTAPTGCASFAHWTANVAVKVGGATVAAGNPIANGATIQDINNDITLTAVWKLAAPTITDNGDNTFSITGSIGGASYYYTTNGSTPTTSSSLYSSAVDFSAGAADITAKAIAHKTGYVDSDPASQACTYHAAVTCTGSPTALVSGTLYQVSDMASACLGEITSTGQYFYGLSSNGKFYVNGTTNSNNASTGTVEIKTASNTIDKINFTGIAWFKGTGTNTCRSIKFVVPSAGTLTIYGKTSSGNGNVVIKTESSGNTTVIANSVNAYASGSTTVSAGTYYVLSDGVSAAIVGLKFVESACTTPAAPTAFSAGSITSTGATFTITDAGDAASYDIYYSTSSTAPTAGTAATTTSDSKTKAVTGLTASTTYYAWVRSVCDADHKSAWVALTGSSFTTTSTPAVNDGCWDPANTAADKLTSGDVSLTTFDNNFSSVAGITSVTIQSKGTSDGQCSGADEGTPSGYMKVKNASSSGVKIITIVTSAAKDITIGGEQYGSYTGSFYLVKSTNESTKLADCNTGATAKATNCPAGTYYVYAKGNSSKSINFSLLCIEDAAPDVTAPTFVSSVPANGATGVATSGTIVLTFSEALGTVDASKFTLTGATKGAVSIDGTDATKVNIAYSGAANEATVTLATAAAAVSDLAGNALAAALSNISFTTTAAGPEALIHWIMTVDASTWSLNGSPTTTDGTNITSISSSIDAASNPSTGASGTTAKVALAAASDNVSNAASFTFTVNSTKKVEPERVTCQVFNVGGSSGGQLSYKAQLSDNNGHIYYSTNTVVPASEATLTDATFTFASDLVLTGNVTIKVYGWKSGSAGSAFRMGADVKLFGEVQNATDYTVTHTLSNVTKSAGATSVKEGNNYTATYAVAGDYALPENISVTIGGSPATAGTDYTWTQGTGVVTIPGNKVTGNIVITVTGVEASSILNVTYDGNGSTGGSVPTDDNDYEEGDVVTVLGNTGSLVKTGQSFLGWSTNATPSSGTFYPAGYKFEMPAAPVTLYAVWGTGSDCITITDFETSSHDKSSNKPDSEGKYFYGYKGTKDASHAVTITATNGDCIGVNSGANLKVYGGKYVNIYADNTTTGGTPSTFTNVTSISIKAKVTNASYIATFDIMVGSTTIADNVSLSAATSSFQTYSYSGLNNLSGIVKIINNNSGSSSYSFLVDDIEICTGSGASGHTVSFDMNDHGSAIANIANVPDGSKIGAPIPEPTAVDWDFGGWYKEAGCTNAWDFASDVVSSNTTLYAKWTNCAPIISTHPLATSYTQNESATPLTVVANTNGGGELSYQWWVKENDLPEEDGSAIPGETGTSFTPSTELLGTTYYYCVVSNDCGNTKTNTAAITISDGHPTPTANWTIEEPKEGGKGFTFSIEVNKNNGDNWDGELLASMLTLSDNAILDAYIVVDNTNKTISGTYGVKAGSSSPVTFYLLLPATATQSATRLDQGRTFSPCAGGVGDSYNVPVRKDYEKDASNNYRWVTLGAGEITYAVSSSISSAKAASTVASVFDYIMSNDKQYVWVKTYEANTKTIRLYVETSGANISVSALYKNTVYATAADKDIVSSDDYTVSYNGSGTAENTGAKGTHYMDITFDSPLDANDIICIKFSSSKVKAYGAVLTTVGDGGDQTTGLTWSNSLASGATLEKREDDPDFAITAVRDATAEKSLGAISYTSSNTAIATVNASTGQVHIADNIDFGSDEFKTTTITATLAASGCYKKAVITYILKVTKYVCPDKPGTITYVDRGCSGMDLTLEDYEEGATIQWYKDGATISGATSATYNATEPGEYYAVTYKTCYITSTNSVTLEAATATAEKIVDSWYVKNGRRTPDIALVQTTGATSFTVTSGGTPVENIGGCTFELKDDGIIYLHGQTEDGSAPSDMTAGDMTITITVSGCAGTLSGLDITIHKQAKTAKPSIAFVVDGTLRKDGGTASSVLTAKTSDRPIWIYLSESYDLTGCNVYWSVDSKELREYYSQFDAILITDDPITQTNGTGGVPYVKAFGTMVDVRPILTMEAFVGRYSDGGWHVYNASPSSPNPRQVEMKLECKNHDIFKGLNPATSENVRMTIENGNEYWHVIMVDTTLAPYHNTTSDYEALPALQGFDPTKFDHMLGVGTIFNETLQGGVERQEEPAARMMILGIQNNAMGALTTEGKLVIKNALDYLLKTNMEDVNDCSNYFTDETGDHLWNTANNWKNHQLPDFETRARILRPVVVDGVVAHAARVDIISSGTSKHVSGECNGSVTINPQGALIVGGKVQSAVAPHYGIDDLKPTELNELYIKSSDLGNGTLIMDNSNGENKAYVEMYSKAQNNGGATTWQYIGVPYSDVNNALYNYYDSWLYSWSPTNGWEVVPTGGAVTPWTGYSITHPEAGHTYVMEGTLEATGEVDIDVPANSFQIIGNSWTAPIQIHNFEDDDFGDIEPTIYFFNTGLDEDGTGTLTPDATGDARWAAGTYVSVPIHSSPYLGKDSLISSLQGFYVTNNAGAATLHLDYDKLVRPMYPWQDLKSGPMHAPASMKMRNDDKPVVAKLFVSGNRYDDRLVILERSDFSRGYDRGWDGEKWAGNNASPMIWVDNENGGAEAVMATDDLEGTVIGFRAGEDEQYTFYFNYDGMEEALYLLDLDTKIYTRMLEENNYTFNVSDKDTHYRFVLTRKNPEVATDIGNIQSDQVPSIKAKKLLIGEKLYILLNGALYDATGKAVK